MGFDAVWISPVTAQIEGQTAYGEAFHGYWQNNIFLVNEHFGTADDLKALSAALHTRDMVRDASSATQHRVRLIQSCAVPHARCSSKPLCLVWQSIKR